MRGVRSFTISFDTEECDAFRRTIDIIKNVQYSISNNTESFYTIQEIFAMVFEKSRMVDGIRIINNLTIEDIDNLTIEDDEC